ncbi:hypothetical protein AC579_2444 [Pseudocercospora musae]|uniref:Stress-response A/B barrel domain-containing protein n=1 Tax=Pseudocercospora musae TaxID=113226 RepID=A0A139HZ37_9PEZI|nr:hypothetical protein AC579_2444 [Pseudocercospora musae]
MTVVHIVLFKFQREISQAQKGRFVSELKKLKSSITRTPSVVTSELMFPYKEDLVRFDFEVDKEDEHLCQFKSFREVNGDGS